MFANLIRRCQSPPKCWRYLILFVLAEGLALGALIGLQRQREADFFQQKLAQYEQAYQVSLEAYSLVAQTLHDQIINRPEIIGIFQQAHQANAQRQAILRAQLLEALNPTYQHLRHLNLKQLHFHLPDSSSFLRFHRPEKFGDPLADVRYSVKLANTALVPVQGFEEGRIYNGFRYVFPLFANDGSQRHIGSVETSMSFRALRDRLEKTSNGYYNLLLRRDVVDIKVLDDEKQENYRASDLSADFVYEVSNANAGDLEDRGPYSPEAIAAINRAIRPRVEPKLAARQPFALVTRSPQEHRAAPHVLVSFLPMKNLQGETVAYLVAYEPELAIAAYRYSFYIQVAGVSLSIFLFAIFLYANQHSKTILKQSKAEIETAFEQLQHAQAQLIQSEKMVSLGQLVGGIAHEINNPVSFIYGNSIYAKEYAQELLQLIELYQDCNRSQHPEIQEVAAHVDLDFIRQDFFRLIDSMQTGAERIRRIVASLRNFSRLDEAGAKVVQLRDCLDSTLAMLSSRLEATETRPAIALQRDEGDLPSLECYPGELNQALLNILSNAIEAFEPWSDLADGRTPQIRLQASCRDGAIALRIADNGKGIPAKVLPRVFNPFFTTKPIGTATGLGLAVSYQSVVERHGGRLDLHSQVGQGTEVSIELPLRLTAAPPQPVAAERSSLSL